MSPGPRKGAATKAQPLPSFPRANVNAHALWQLAAGLAVCLGVAALSWTIAQGEVRLFQHAVIEPLVVAVVLGVLVRAAWGWRPRLEPGVRFSSRTLLNASVVLLGMSVNLREIADGGWSLLVLAGAVVTFGTLTATVFGRLLSLPTRLAVLVGVGNSICGNSAIAAAAPAIGATRDEVAVSISLTALLGVVEILCLPLLISLLGLSDYQYGVLAGLTVYSVPQVVAASLPVSTLAGQIAMITKLTRVLFLGPVVLGLSVLFRRQRRTANSASSRGQRSSYVPGFVLGFLALALIRTAVGFPGIVTASARDASTVLFIVSMAGLGLEVDLKAAGRTAPRVGGAVLLSLAFILMLAVIGIHVLGIGGDRIA